LRLYRRSEELTQWERFVQKQFPDRVIPLIKQERARLHKEVDPVLLQDPDFQALHAPFHTKIDLAIDLLEAAIRHKVPFGVLLFDGWYLSEALVTVAARRKKDWVSIVKRNRKLETNSFGLRDATGAAVALPPPHITIEHLVPHMPPTAYRPVVVGTKTYWCFSLSVRIPTLGKVRLVISFETAEVTGTYVVLVTNRLDWNAQKIIATYLLRWPTETFYQDGKGHLGLADYRMRNAEAIEKHWCLVFVAYSFLHLECLPPSPTKGSIPVKTIGEACRQQAQMLLQHLLLYVHDQLLRGAEIEAVFARVFAKQGAVLAT
jgi:Transposase DDE domain